MAIQILNRKKTKKVDFMQFLSRVPSRDYVFQRVPYEEQEKKAAELLKANRKKRVVLLELGVGFNTPTIIRFPFEKMVRENEKWSLIRLNLDEAVVPESLGRLAVGINEDIARSIKDISSCIGAAVGDSEDNSENREENGEEVRRR